MIFIGNRIILTNCNYTIVFYYYFSMQSCMFINFKRCDVAKLNWSRVSFIEGNFLRFMWVEKFCNVLIHLNMPLAKYLNEINFQ